MEVKITANPKSYAETLDLYAKLRRQEHRDVVNRMAYYILIRTIKTVPKANLKKHPLRPEDKPGKTTYRQHGKKSRLFYALATKAGAKKGDNGELTKAATAIYNRKRQARGAIAAGFVKCLRAFDGLGLSGKLADRPQAKYLQPKPGMSASRSKAKTAAASGGRGIIRAWAENEVLGSGEVAPPVMDAAIAREIADKAKYIQNKLQKLNNAVQAGHGYK